MAQLIAPDYKQPFLFPPALEELVPSDHPARFLREFVDQLDLPSLGFAMPAASEGRPPYAPSLLKIWLYGYMRRIRTLRSLEAACREELSLLWLTGFHQPDHNTLWRFWRDNRKALRKLFQSAAQLALKAGLVGLVLQAVDGTKIQAVASGRSGWSQEQMSKLLRALEKELEETESQIESEGEPPAAAAYRLPENLQDKQALHEVVKTGLAQLQVSGRKHYHPEEPEALRMSCDGKNRFGYNAQVVVDEKAGVIVAAEVIDQENDTGQLAPMVQQAAEVVSQPGAAPVTVADSGYGAGTDIAKASECQFNVLVYPQEGQSSKDNPYHARYFRYEAEQQRVICPQGQELEFAHTTAQ
jgi:transposase